MLVCLNKKNIAAIVLCVNEKEKILINRERFMLGCKALGGKSVTELSEETQINREWIYEQKRRIEKEARSLDTRESVISKNRGNRDVAEAICN